MNFQRATTTRAITIDLGAPPLTDPGAPTPTSTTDKGRSRAPPMANSESHSGTISTTTSTTAAPTAITDPDPQSPIDPRAQTPTSATKGRNGDFTRKQPGSEVLRNAKMRNPHHRKMLYALMDTSQNRCHYFQSYPIRVVISFSLKAILHNREATVRVAKRAVEILEFDLSFVSTHVIKSRALAESSANGRQSRTSTAKS